MKYFTMKELVRSETAKRLGIYNVPSVEEENNLVLLVENILDKIREAYGKPIHVTSGYRCWELNTKIGGSRTSQHMKGMAADIVGSPNSIEENIALFRLIKSLDLPVCQCILEKGGKWIHISYDKDDIRKQYLEI